MAKAKKTGPIELVVPKLNPKQELFFRAKTKYVGYGGAKGGGKSHAMRWLCVVLALKYKDLRILLLRRTYPELRDNHVLPLMKILDGIAKYKDDDKAFSFPNGSRLKLGYCDNDADVLNYQGHEYDVVCFEEATLFTEFQLTEIALCARNTRSDFKPKVYFTCNPGGPGHQYIKRIFIDKEYRGKEKPENYTFIPARVYDNHALMTANPEYVEELENLPEERRRAFLDGDWDVFAGQYFAEFRREKHVIEPFAIPAHWRKFRSIDHGFNDPCAVYWHAIDGDGHIYTYRELYLRLTLASDMAKIIRDLSKDEDISYTVASPDMWQKRGSGLSVGESIAETYLKNGVPLKKADNNRIQGWTRMHEYLANAPDGVPYWQIFSTCKNLIRTLPALVHDDHKVEDVSDKSEDHAPESCFVKGTMIATARGEIPIEQVTTDDSVLTRDGFKKVIHVWQTSSKAMVYKATFSNGAFLIGTANHPIWVVGKGWIPLSKLKKGDEPRFLNANALNLMVSNSEDTLIQKIGDKDFITAQAVITEKEGYKDFTKRFGKLITGLYQMVITSTTKTATPLITLLKTLNVYLCTIIYHNTVKNENQTLNNWNKSDHLQQNGIVQKKAEPTLRKHGKKDLRNGLKMFKRLRNASNAARNIFLKSPTLDFVRQLAERNGEGGRGRIELQRLARFVARNIKLTNTSKITPAPYIAGLFTGITPKGTDAVYNIEVEGCPEYFANGVLVHNCRYALMSRPRPLAQADPEMTGTWHYGELKLKGYSDSQIRRMKGVKILGGKKREGR